jgi:DNA-binding transcriptional ArsR family regulator
MQSADLSTIFAALADPTRRAILARLARGEAPVKDLAEPFELSGPAITKHLKVLEHAGLISRSREGQQRPCRLEPQALEPAADWIEQYRAMWEEQLDRLDAYLKSVAPQQRSDNVSETKSKTTATKTKTSKTTGKKSKSTNQRGQRHDR